MRRPPPVASVIHQTSSYGSKELVCSFCRRERAARQQPSANRGPDGVCICDECIDLCVEILEEERRD
jgi:ClpX C4-type zinc finger